MTKATLLIVDDDASIRESLADRLSASGYRTLQASDGRQGVDVARSEYPDCVLLDIQMPELGGLEVLAVLKSEFPELPVIILTGHGTLETAVEAMKLGACDFLPKPCRPDHLLIVVRKALERKGLKDENRLLREEVDDRFRLVEGADPVMKRTMDLASRVAASDSTVLIGGESGTGKQVFARAIHRMSGRRDMPFVHVSCTTLSEPLLESDLFGHEKGAFTGAHQAKRGRVELADSGTLFLDEIGDLSPAVQAKFLHFLESGEFERVGGLKTVAVDARVITATHRDLEKEVKAGRFREDLYYRLNVVQIVLPPLRERPNDIRPLAEHFLKRFSATMRKPSLAFGPGCVEHMERYAWPGNIRELENAVERAVVLATGPEITRDLLPSPPPEQGGTEIHVGMTLESAMQHFKKDFIRKTLETTGWNQSKASQILAIQRTYLSRLVKELNLREGSR